MKIKSLFLVIILALLSNGALAKSASTKAAVTKKEATKEAEIQPLDFQKLFDEAEKTFRVAKAWKKIKCAPKTGFICTKTECVKRDIQAYVILDKDEETITRCNQDGCEAYEAEFKQTGVLFNIQSEGPIGTLIRVFGDSRYKEITTVGLDAYVANGECVAVVE